MMKLARWLKHWLRSPRAVDRVLPPATLQRIEQAIALTETSHSGEIRFAIEAALPWSYLQRDASARERAMMVFAKLRMWDTDARNGVLIYVELADHGIEIVADRGIAARVPQDDWQQICAALGQRFGAGKFESGLIDAVDAVGRLLTHHFPAPDGAASANQLSNRPVVLGR